MATSFRTLFEHQRSAFESGPAVPPDERIRRLRRLRAALLEQRPAVREALYRDFRKPAHEVDATEVAPIVIEIDHAIRNVHDWVKPQRHSAPRFLPGTSWETRLEPRGPSLILAPWNYPINLTLGPLVHALAAGCPVFIKPSEHTPHASALVADMLGSLFAPEDVVVVQGDAETATGLLELPFRHVYFTGSPAVGRKVMAAAARHLASVTLELGGKSPAVVDETADLADAASKIVFGKFANAGQTCIAPDYLLVHESVHDALIAALIDEISSSYGDMPAARRASPDFARLVSHPHFDRMCAMLDHATTRGAHIAFGGTNAEEERFFEPTLLTNVPDDTTVLREEIFGPILPIIPYRSETDILSRIRMYEPPLSAYVFSKNDALADRVSALVRTGAVCQNETLLHFVNPEVSFGGMAASGVGRGHGHAGFLAFSNEQVVMRRRFGSAIIKQLHPPYGRKTSILVDWLMKLS